MNIETKGNIALSRASPEPQGSARKKVGVEKIKTAVQFSLLPRFACDAQGVILRNKLFIPYAFKKTAEEEAEIDQCHPSSPTFNFIAFLNARTISEKCGKIAELVLSNPAPAKPDLKGQQGIVEKQLKSWSSFAEDHQGITLKEVGFLPLQQFLQLSICILFVEIQKGKKKESNASAAQILVESLRIETWPAIGTKQLSERFTNFLESILLSNSQRLQFKSHFQRLLLLSMQSDCLHLPISSEAGSTDFASRQSLLQCILRILADLHSQLQPTFKDAFSELDSFYRTTNVCYYSLYLSEVIARRKGNKSDEWFYHKLCTVQSVWRDWMKLLHTYTGLKIRRFEEKLKEASLTRNMASLSDLSAKGKELAQVVASCSEELSREIIAFETWIRFYSASKTHLPETEQFIRNFIRNMQKNVANFFYDIARCIVAFYEKNRKEIESGAGKQLRIPPSSFCIEMLRVLHTQLHYHFEKSKPEQLQKKNPRKKILEKVQKNQPKILVDFTESLLSGCEEAAEKFLCRFKQLFLEVEDLCPGDRNDRFGQDKEFKFIDRIQESIKNIQGGGRENR